jgi:hypothetical protein
MHCRFGNFGRAIFLAALIARLCHPGVPLLTGESPTIANDQRVSKGIVSKL